MLGLLSLLIFMGLLSSFNNTDNSYDLKINNMEYTSKGFIDNKEIIKSLISKKQFQNLIKNNDFLEVEAKLKEIKSIENIVLNSKMEVISILGAGNISENLNKEIFQNV